MFNHVTVGARPSACMAALRYAVPAPDGGPPARCWSREREALPRFHVRLPFDGQPAAPGIGCTVAFLVPLSEAMQEARAAGLAAGGRGHHGAYLHEPEADKPHVVHRADLAGE